METTKFIDDRIDAEDKKYLECAQKAYESKLAMFKEIWERFNAEHDFFENEYPAEIAKSLGKFAPEDFEIVDKAQDLQQVFRDEIFRYFRNKYQVFTIENKTKLDFNDPYMHYNKFLKKEVELKKLNFDKVFGVQNYHDVLDDIFKQLGNISFMDLAIKEAKENLYAECYNKYKRDWWISVKGSVISYRNGFGHLEEGWTKGSYRYYNPQFIYRFLCAYSVMLFGCITKIDGVEKIMNDYHFMITEDEVNNGFVPNCEGNIIEKIKIFKNGRVDIKFQTAEQAKKFADEWCGMGL